MELLITALVALVVLCLMGVLAAEHRCFNWPDAAGSAQ